MTVGVRPWQVLNVPYPERYPEEYPPPLEVQIEGDRDSTFYHVILEPGRVEKDLPPRRSRWSVVGRRLRPIAAAIAVDMASPLLLADGLTEQEASTGRWVFPRAQFLIQWILDASSLTNLLEEAKLEDVYAAGLEVPYHAELRPWIEDLERGASGPWRYHDPATPFTRALAAVRQLAAAVPTTPNQQMKMTLGATVDALWALVDVPVRGGPVSSGLQHRQDYRDIKEAHEVADRLRYWVDLWWSEVLEVYAWHRHKVPPPLR